MSSLNETVIVMPVYRRPEFMALSLEALRRVPDMPRITVYGDYTEDLKLLGERFEAYQNYAPRGTRYVDRQQHIYAPSGCWNILNSLRDGYVSGARYVALIEEDVIIRPEWLDWSVKRMEFDHKILATCGRQSRFTAKYGHLYTNPGAVLSRRLLRELIPHINDTYFTDLGVYLDEHFPVWPEMSNLDDGLIRRVIRKLNGYVHYPEKPMVAHIGYDAYEQRFAGYHAEGNLEERVAGLRRLLRDLKPDDRLVGDLERLD